VGLRPGHRSNTGLFKVRFIQDSGLFKVRFIQDSGLFKVRFIQDSDIFKGLDYIGFIVFLHIKQ